MFSERARRRDAAFCQLAIESSRWRWQRAVGRRRHRSTLSIRRRRGATERGAREISPLNGAPLRLRLTPLFSFTNANQSTRGIEFQRIQYVASECTNALETRRTTQKKISARIKQFLMLAVNDQVRDELDQLFDRIRRFNTQS